MVKINGFNVPANELNHIKMQTRKILDSHGGPVRYDKRISSSKNYFEFLPAYFFQQYFSGQ